MSSNDYDESLENERPYVLPIFSRLPAGLSPTRGVIYQGPAIGWSLFVGVIAFFMFTLIVWGGGFILNHNTMWDQAEMKAMVGSYVAAWLHLIPLAINAMLSAAVTHPHLWSPWFESETSNLLDMLRAYPFGLGIRLVVPIVGSMGTAWFVLDRMLIPQYKAQHADGAQFIRGKAAVDDLRNRMTKPYSPKAARTEAMPYVMRGRIPTAVQKYQAVRNMDRFLTIHPDIGASIKRVFNAGVILSGAPGSGKSVILIRWMWEAIQRDYRSMIFDPKGEFVQLLGRYPGVKILSPFDKRSMVWDVAMDCNTDPAMNAFVGALIPKSDKNPFFDVAAQMLMVGIMKTLYAEKGLAWGFTDLALGITQPLDVMVENLQKYAPAAKEQYDFALDAAAQNIAGGDQSQTVNNIRASLSVGARLVGQLARAWGKPKKSAVKFSAKAWAQDGYTGPRQILLMTGEDKDLSGAYVASVLNAAFRTVLNDLTNDESRRLCFFMDEFPELPVKHIIVDRVMAVARGFGVCVFLAYQDHAQVIDSMGENKADTMLNLAALKVYCRVMPGSKYVQAIADGLGKSRITLTTISQSVASGQAPTVTTSSHTETRSLVTPVQLTSEVTMGLREPYERERWQNWKPTGKAIRAILTMGTHVYRLDWPIMNTSQIKAKYGAKRSVPAKWTLAIGEENTAAASLMAPAHVPEPEAVVEHDPNEPIVEDPLEQAEVQELDTTDDGITTPPPTTVSNASVTKSRRNDEHEPTANDEAPNPTGQIIGVVNEPTAPAEPHPHRERKAHVPKIGPDGKPEIEIEEDDPLASAAADLGIELGLHAVGLGAVAPAVEVGKALIEAVSGSKTPSTPTTPGQPGKRSTTVLFR